VKAVIYCRVSTKEQVENLSLETQEKACRRYCLQQSIEIVRVFIEEGKSAKTEHRTEFNKMLEYCRKNKRTISHVVVHSIDRFSRNTSVFLAAKAELSGHNIEFRP
jgi:site-specific DNA recombinase